MARKPGFLEDRSNPGWDIQGDDNDGKDVTLSLVPEAVITGSISLPTSEPPDSITLQLFRRVVSDGEAQYMPAGMTRSTSDGQFRFAELRAGIYKLLTHELLDRDPLTFDPRGPQFGYPPVFFPNAPDFASAGTIEVVPGQTQTVSLSLVKQAYYRIRIPVITLGGGAPEQGLFVTVSAHGHNGPGFTLGYNNNDHAIAGSLPNGTYMVEALSWPNGAMESGIETITVKGGPVDGTAIVLVPSSAIPVEVKEEFTSADPIGRTTWNVNGRNVDVKGPRRYLNVTLDPVDNFGMARGSSLRNGNVDPNAPLEIESSPAGSYWVHVNSSRGYAASIRSGNLDLKEQPLVVGAGGTAAPIEITMRDETAEISGKVEGVVQGSDAGTAGAAVNTPYPVRRQASAHVYFVPLPDSSGRFTQQRADPDGSFDHAALAPGAYRLLAFDHQQPELEYRNPEAMRAYDSKGPVVRVSAGQKEQVTLQLIHTEQ